MAISTPSIKRHNHRIHPCDQTRKDGLLKHLLTLNEGKDILIVTADDPASIEGITQDEHIVIKSDTELTDATELTCDLLVSYDLPEDASDYMARLTHTKAHAVILLSQDEQTALYPIEMLLGRNIMQEVITGFEPLSGTQTKARGPRQRDERRQQRPRSEGQRDRHPEKKPYEKKRVQEGERAKKAYVPKKDSTSSTDKGKRPSRYIGKDENGKPMFSGKSGERNHRYDGSPKDPSKRPDDKKGTERSRDERPRSYRDGTKDEAKGKKPDERSKSYGDKKQQRPYDKDSRPKGKPSDNSTKKRASKRPPRTFRVKAEERSKEDQ